MRVPQKIGDEPVSAVEVVATHPGFATSRVGPIALDGAAELPPLEIVLTEESSIEGKVLDAGGAPIAGAWVAAARAIPPIEQARVLAELVPGADLVAFAEAEDAAEGRSPRAVRSTSGSRPSRER